MVGSTTNVLISAVTIARYGTHPMPHLSLHYCEAAFIVFGRRLESRAAGGDRPNYTAVNVIFDKFGDDCNGCRL